MAVINKYTKGLEMKNFLMLTVDGMVNAFGVTIFLSPVKLYDSGISGTSMMLSGVSGISLL
ncbi:MAG: YitT family protein [Oscillospiraceae bacterium]|nr:YitT family protein [Oscillospiraceae bacterium]